MGGFPKGFQMRRTFVTGAFALICILGGSLFGQVLTGMISGTVSDSSGAVVPSAMVTIVNADTGVTVFQGATNESGLYRAPSLPVSRYDVIVELPGFKRVQISGINLTVDQRAAINVTLQLGAVEESITVAGQTAGQLATESSSLGNTINMTQVQNLPLPNRNILNLLSLTAGISSGGDATSINASQLSMNGSRTVNSEFTVNGVSVVSGSTGGVQTLPSADAIREVKVLTSAYSAEYGRTSGGTVTLITNSGTDQYHGGVYEYFRNEALNANNFFNNVLGKPRSQDRYNLFGGKLGGPVRIPKLYDGKDRTFFFFNYEGLRQSSPYFNTSTVPDAAFRSGNFSGARVPVFDPSTNTAFDGNTIPVGRIDTAAAKILSVLPLPNSPGSFDASTGVTVNNLVEIGSTKPSNNSYTGRIDESLSAKDRMFGVLTHFNNQSPAQPKIPGPLENNVGPGVTTGYQVIIGYTHTFSSTLLLDTRMGYWRNDSEIQPPSLGINVQNVFGIQRSIGPASPTFKISGWTDYGLNSNTLRSQIDNNFQPSGSLTKVWRNHVVKFGVDLRKNQFNIYNPGGTGNSGWFTGQYTFNGEITSSTHNSGNPVNSLADFLLGAVKSSGYALPQPPAGRRNSNLGIYVQDDWKAAPKLTLNLGVRYEYESPMTSSNNIYSRVDTNTGQVLFAGINASPTLNLEASKLNFAPRVGLAYNFTPKTVIRSGFGIFYSQIFSDLGAQVLFPGYTISQSFGSLGTGIAQPFTLSQGMPLIAVQNLQNPQSTLSQFGPTNPLSASASFAEAGPLPYASQWNFGLQREVARGLIFEANYAGSSGVHLPLNLPYNRIPFSAATQAAQVGTQVFTQSLRPFPSVAAFNAISMAGHSSYHGLQITAQRQYSGNLAFIANYTRSKSIDDGSGLFSFSQPEVFDEGQFPAEFRQYERAVSAFDRPNVFSAAVQYRTSGPRWLRNIEFDPIITARDGLPTSITQNNLNSAARGLRPNVINTASIYVEHPYANGTGIQYLLPVSAANFPLGPVGPLFTGSGATRTLVLPAGIGTLGRNAVRTPGEFNVDLAVGREFPIREAVKFKLRAEAFNIFNHTNFRGPSTSSVSLTATTNAQGEPIYNSPGFGIITAARAARFMQLVARIEF
jgi:Carboxypeptidase regulatory-like domain/TonB dependent receptor-like, beta-barrel/TonB-dependent Receptor Plug Domain